jgi:hypothetical protein
MKLYVGFAVLLLTGTAIALTELRGLAECNKEMAETS